MCFCCCLCVELVYCFVLSVVRLFELLLSCLRVVICVVDPAHAEIRHDAHEGISDKDYPEPVIALAGAAEEAMVRRRDYRPVVLATLGVVAIHGHLDPVESV